MRSEYLLFNVVVFALPFVCGLVPYVTFKGGRWAAFTAASIAAVPFLVWDAFVTGAHWSFNPKYTLGIQIAGLPIEEILFFFTVPFACMYTWEMFFVKVGPWKREPRQSLRVLSYLWLVCVPAGAYFLWLGKGYTGLMLVSLGLAVAFDLWTKMGLLAQVRTYVFLGLVAGFTFLFNGYLTGRPVVLYDVSAQLDWRLWTIPIEDFGYGTALVLLNLVLYQRLRGRFPEGAREPWIHGWIEGRFNGYRHRVVTPDASLPLKIEGSRKVAVVGGGLAGMRAAMTLAERGFHVTLFEKNDYLGGKVGSWETTTEGGEQLPVSHGFHAFFRHYYNLNAMLTELGVDDRKKTIDDYLILGEGGQQYSFKQVATPPVVNLLSLANHGLYNLREVALGPAGREMEVFLRYDEEKTYAEYDELSFERFSERAKLPGSLQLIFNSFARAFFSDPDRMSMAALIESFHFYYLSHDHGLLYDYLDEDYEETLLGPVRHYLEERGAEIRLSTPVESFDRQDDHFDVNGEAFDYVVMAADVAAARHIVGGASSIQQAHPDWCRQMNKQHAAQGYSVWRLWVDRDLPAELSPFFITDRVDVLDAIAIYHRLETSAKEWVSQNGGGILELHCYAAPEGFNEADMRRCFMSELLHYFPSLDGMTIHHEYFQLRKDFAAFHVGMGADRPCVETPVPGLVLAGDWVKLPYPSMLMEAACMSGLLSANAICAAEGVQGAPVDSVPLRGILADAPSILGGRRQESS